MSIKSLPFSKKMGMLFEELPRELIGELAFWIVLGNELLEPGKVGPV